MRIRVRTTVRRMMLLLTATTAFVTGVSAFYFYAAAAILFQPDQPALETTQSLTPLDAAAPSVEIRTAPPFTSDEQWTGLRESCRACVQDELFGTVLPVNGEYVNETFRYSIRIPEEVWAMTSPPPVSDIGFAARILSDPTAVIYVDAGYDLALLNSSEKAADEMINNLRKEFGESVLVVERTRGRLGKRTGVRYTAQYIDYVNEMRMVEEGIVALRKESALTTDEPGIIYSVRLRTAIYKHQEKSAVLEKIGRRWRDLKFIACSC